MNKDARAAGAGRIFVALEKEVQLIGTAKTEGGEFARNRGRCK